MKTIYPYVLVEVESDSEVSSLILEDQTPELGVVKATSSSSDVYVGSQVLFGKEVEELSMSLSGNKKLYLMEESNIKLILEEGKMS